MEILNQRFKAAQLSLVNQKPNPNPWFNIHPARAEFRIHAPIWCPIHKLNEDFELKIQGRTTFISAPKANSLPLVQYSSRRCTIPHSCTHLAPHLKTK
jgi:hypothetical protein